MEMSWDFTLGPHMNQWHAKDLDAERNCCGFCYLTECWVRICHRKCNVCSTALQFIQSIRDGDFCGIWSTAYRKPLPGCTHPEVSQHWFSCSFHSSLKADFLFKLLRCSQSREFISPNSHQRGMGTSKRRFLDPLRLFPLVDHLWRLLPR